MSSILKIKKEDEKLTQFDLRKINSFIFNKNKNNENSFNKNENIYFGNSSDSLNIKENSKMRTDNSSKTINLLNNKNENARNMDSNTKAKTKSGFAESNNNYFLKEISDRKSESSTIKKKRSNEKVVNIYDDFPLDHENLYSTINFSPIYDRKNNAINLNILANKNEKNFSSTKNKSNLINKFENSKLDNIDPDFYFFFAEKNLQARKTSMNFNKNPGLIKRGNFKFSCSDFNQISDKKQKEILEKEDIEEEADYANINQSNYYCNKLPHLNQTPANNKNLHRKNKIQISLKNNFLDSFNKYTNSNSSKELLINKNIIYNSATDFEAKLNQVKSMEKFELYNRSFNKARILKEKMYKSNKKERDFLMLKTKFDNFLANSKDLFKLNFSQKNFNSSEINKKNKESNNEKNSTTNFFSKNKIGVEKEKVKMDLYSLKKIKNLNIFGEDNPYNAEKRLDNIYGIFSNMKKLKKIQHMKIINPKYLREIQAANGLEIGKSNNRNNKNLHVLTNTGSFTLPRTVNEYVKGYHPINNIINEDDKRTNLIDIFDRKKY
jgi:hypothetical protein